MSDGPFDVSRNLLWAAMPWVTGPVKLTPSHSNYRLWSPLGKITALTLHIQIEQGVIYKRLKVFIGHTYQLCPITKVKCDEIIVKAVSSNQNL